MTRLPEHVVLVNNTCAPGCTSCPGAELSLDGCGDVAAAASSLVYLGWEALDGSVAVADALRAVPPGAQPVLVTHGAGGTDPAVLAARLDLLRGIRPAQVVYALDMAHYRAAGIERVRALLGLLRAGTTHLKVVFALPPGCALPVELLDCEEMSRGCELVAYRGDRLCAARDRRELYRALPAARRTPSEPVANPYPLAFHALVLENTYFCNAACAHCYTSSGPHAGRHRLPVEDLTRVIDQAAELPNLARRLHVGGGESTIFWRELLAVLGHAAGRGFNNGITTNGFWAASVVTARRRMAELVGAGVRRLELSVDAMHQDFIPRTVVANLLRTVPDFPIQLILRVTTTRKQSAARALAHLSTEDHGSVHVVTGVAHATGRAATAIPAEDFWTRPGLPEGHCADILNLTVTPDGGVYPCCAGSELCPSLRIGSIHEQSLAEMMAASRGHFLLRTLIHAGPRHFAGLVAGTGLAGRLRPGYEDICDLCGHLFTDPEMAEAVRQRLDLRVGELRVAAARSTG